MKILYMGFALSLWANISLKFCGLTVTYVSPNHRVCSTGCLHVWKTASTQWPQELSFRSWYSSWEILAVWEDFLIARADTMTPEILLYSQVWGWSQSRAGFAMLGREERRKGWRQYSPFPSLPHPAPLPAVASLLCPHPLPWSKCSRWLLQKEP